MKKPKITAFVLAAVLSSTPVLAAEVPKEAAPINVTEESIIITENLIMDLCQYFGQKKLKYYADFFSSSSSLCCGVI